MPVEGGHYYDLYLHPLKDAETVQDIEKFPWPNPLDPTRYVNLKARVDQVVYEEKKAYVAGRMSAGMWENAIWMCGYEKFLTDMLLNKKLIHAIMSKFLEIKMKNWEKYLEEVGDNVLIISEADDLGTQNGLLVSLDLYRELIWPYHKQLFEFIKRKARSQPAMRTSIEALKEAGVRDTA